LTRLLLHGDMDHYIQRSICFVLGVICLQHTFANSLATNKFPPAPMSSLPMDKLANHANSYASAHGVQVERRNEKGGSYYECAPISLLPNAYPRSAFNLAKKLAGPYNELVDRVSRDSAFLQKALGGGVSDQDPYTAKLLELYNKIYVDDADYGKFARVADRLGIHRSDYMLTSSGKGGEYQPKQVELNTIASSFAGLSASVADLHRFLTKRYKDELGEFLEHNKKVAGDQGGESTDEEDGVPVNPTMTCLPQAFNAAHEQYKTRFLSQDNKDTKTVPVVLFVVQEGETNTVDQRKLEFALFENHGIPVVRMSLTAAHTQLEVDESTGALYIVDQNESSSTVRQEVSVVYFRAGYAPTDYPDGMDGIEWQAREKMEISRATKSPCLGFHLSGTKKVQQELASHGVLENYFPNPEESSTVELMRSTFAGLYSLGDDADEETYDAVKKVLSGKEGNYVLKPQREGGGYNTYGKDIAKKLKENVVESTEGLQLSKELGEFILMERLFPPHQESILLRAGLVEGHGDSISELGCFGTVVTSHDGEVLHNEYGGFILRTKFSGVDEGGVAAGFATLSSPYLC